MPANGTQAAGLFPSYSSLVRRLPPLLLLFDLGGYINIHPRDLPVALSGGIIASYKSLTVTQYGVYLNRATSNTKHESVGG